MSSRLCKYGCGKELTWDTATKSFKEGDGTPHTPERCKSLQAKPAQIAAESAAKSDGDYSKMHAENMTANRLLVAAINRLAAAIEAKQG